MIRKIIGWGLAVISTILLLGTIGIGIHGFSSSNIELSTSVFQSGITSFFVSTGLSILLLRKQQNYCSRVSRWHKARRILGYTLLIMFIFSLPGLHYFDVYEILPRVFILITAYLLFRSYEHKELNNKEENTPNDTMKIQISDNANSIREHKTVSPNWQLKSERNFTQEEINQVVQAVVVSSQYGNSIQFTMKTGAITYIPLEQSSNLTTGTIIDITKVKLLTLEKDGESDIYRMLPI